MSFRLTVAIVLIAGTQVALTQFDRQSRQHADRANTFDVTQLPMKLQEWMGKEADFAPDVLQTVGALTIANRLYQRADGRAVSVLVCTFPTGDDLLPHPPDLCYRGEGWSVLGETWATGSGRHRCKLMPVERDNERALVIYWYQLGEDVVSHRGELRKVLQRIRWEGKPWPPLVKVMLHAPIEISDKDVRTDMEDLGGQIYDWVLAASDTTASQTTDPTSGSP